MAAKSSASGDACDPHVVFDHVQKSYDGETYVVTDLCLEIRRGEFLTMLGPSGSGKTTCLMMLAGFETPTSGTILVQNQAINSVPPHKRGIGMVFQNYALFPHMTVAQNLAFPLAARGENGSTIQTKVERALDMVKLNHDTFGNRKPGQLSGGQQQRVALARALVFEPELVLMDEPLGALDKQLREHMQFEIKHIHERLGVTIVFVTHDQSEALTMSDRIAVFNDGVIQQLDSPRELYENPKTSFVAQFIGENNHISGTVEACSQGNAKIRLSDGSTLISKAAVAFSEGQKTLISVRPERIELAAQAGTYENTLNARVEEVTYRGDQIRTRMSLLDGTEVIAKTRNRQGAPMLEVGSIVAIGLRSDDCRALEAPLT